MDSDMKCVIVLDGALPSGMIANAAAILGMTLGKNIPEFVGEDVVDASGCVHKGITLVPMPVLKGTREILKTLRNRLYAEEFGDLVAADFSDVAQSCAKYGHFIDKSLVTKQEDHAYLGIAMFGDRKKVNRLTGSLPLLK
jgi:hypothetical protein